MGEHTYMIQCGGIERACCMMIRFMNDVDVYLPECALLGSNDSAGLIPAAETANTEKLIAYIQSHGGAVTIICTAATDQQDINRVVLAYIAELNILTLSFPMAQGQLSEKEKALLGRMSILL